MLVCRKLFSSALFSSLLVLGFAGGYAVCPAQAQAPETEAVPQLPPSPRGEPLRPLPSKWTPKSIAYLKASNSKANFQFGYVVALSSDGNTMAVGAIGEDSAATGINGNQSGPQAISAGAVYVYTRNGGSWVQQAYVKSSNTKANQQFGSSLALSADGNTLAVGAIGEASSSKGVNGNQADVSMPNSGAVYVFTRSGMTWSQQAYVKASNTGEKEDGDQFGYAVTLSSDGNTMAVSAISEDSAAGGINGNQNDNSAEGAGAVYIFGRSGSDWSQQAYVKPWNTTVRGGLFGYSVGLSGNGETLAVGTYDEDRGRGAVYIFTHNNNVWSQQARLVSLNAEAGDSLGCSISVSEDGNTVVAGAFDEDSLLRGEQPPTEGTNDAKSDVSTGAAYVFVRKGTAWSEQAFIKATNTRLNDQFAWALSLSRDGNTLAVGAHLEDSGAKGLNGDQEDASAQDSGAVYVYERFNTTWLPVSYVKAPNPEATAEFGISLALSGNGKVLAVGAFNDNRDGTGVDSNPTNETATESGATYIYY
ncbi:MAG TPA: integrin [Candidatus Dormibacteraeota bacterium]|nr:integrin [Candidatus Dormibacteraeota bacterium]